MTRYRSTRGRSRRTLLATLGALAVAPGVIAATNHDESDDDGERSDEPTDDEADAADENASETDDEEPSDDVEAARVRIVHLSPDAPTVDVYVDDELRFEEVEPYATQSGYRESNPDRTRSPSRPVARAARPRSSNGSSRSKPATRRSRGSARSVGSRTPRCGSSSTRTTPVHPTQVPDGSG